MARTLDGAVTGSLSFNLILLVILLGVTIAWVVNRCSEVKEKEQIICEPCAHLSTDGTVPDGCKKNETDKCCCKASVLINALVKKLAKEKFGDYRLRETAAVIQPQFDCGVGPRPYSIKKAPAALFQSDYGGGQRPSGKVSGVDFDSLKKDTRERDLVYWEKSEHSILDSVRYNNGRFTIINPGYYYVFSQINYEHDPESTKISDSRQIHTLYRYSLRTREQKLLENSRTFAELHAPANNGTSFFGSVFRFETDDEIMIKSSHTHRISGNDKENFFGLHTL